MHYLLILFSLLVVGCHVTRDDHEPVEDSPAREDVVDKDKKDKGTGDVKHKVPTGPLDGTWLVTDVRCGDNSIKGVGMARKTFTFRNLEGFEKDNNETCTRIEPLNFTYPAPGTFTKQQAGMLQQDPPGCVGNVADMPPPGYPTIVRTWHYVLTAEQLVIKEESDHCASINKGLYTYVLKRLN